MWNILEYILGTLLPLIKSKESFLGHFKKLFFHADLIIKYNLDLKYLIYCLNIKFRETFLDKKKAGVKNN